MAGSGSNVTQSSEVQVEATESQLLLEKRYIGRLAKGVPTVDVANVEHWVAVNTVAQNITYFRNGQPGQHLYILGDGFTTIVHTPGVIENVSEANELLDAGLVRTYLMYDDGVWYEQTGSGEAGPPGPSLPEAADATERNTLYPSPAIGFKVLMLDSDTLVRWNGTIWETTLAGGEGPPGPAGTLRGVVYAADTLDKTGVADIAIGMDAIIAAAAGNFVEILFERGTYRIATGRSWGAKVKLTFQPGAKIQIDGVNVYFVGMIEAGHHQIFERINGGQLYLHGDFGDTWNNEGALITEILMEWFGALGDNNAWDDDAFDFGWETCRGMPKTPLDAPSWTRSAFRLRSGGIYKKRRMWRLEAAIGPAIVGGGPENTQIAFRGNLETYTATGYPANNQVQLSGTMPENLVGRWIVMAGPDEWGTHREIITDLGGGLVQVALYGGETSHGWTDLNQTVYLLENAVIDLNGIHDAYLEGFTIDLSNNLDGFGELNGGGAVMAGVYYHRQSNRVARGSSNGNFNSVKISGAAFHIAGWAIGSFHGGDTGWQEDLASFWGCKAIGRWKDLKTELKVVWNQHGFRFGSGAFANPLNYTLDGCVSLNWSNGLTCGATNLKWAGGTIQSNNNDIYIYNGTQGYVEVGGFRSEGSGCLMSGFTGQSVGFMVKLHDIEFQAETMKINPETGTYDFIVMPFNGTFEINNVRAMNAVFDKGVDSGDIPYTAIGTDAQGNGYVEFATAAWPVDKWKNGYITMKEKSVDNQSTLFQEMYEVLSNTATRITIRGSWLTGSFGELGSDWPTLYPANGTTHRFILNVPIYIRKTSAGLLQVKMQNCLFQHIRKETLLIPYTDGSDPTMSTVDWSIDNCPPCDADIRPKTEIRQSQIRYGMTVIKALDFVTPSMGTPDMEWVKHECSKIQLTTDYTIPLGGVNSSNYPINRVPFPVVGTTLVFEITQDGTGGRALAFTCSKPVKWEGGVAPSASWAANVTRRYEFIYTGTAYLARLLGEYS